MDAITGERLDNLLQRIEALEEVIWWRRPSLEERLPPAAETVCDCVIPQGCVRGSLDKGYYCRITTPIHGKESATSPASEGSPPTTASPTKDHLSGAAFSQVLGSIFQCGPEWTFKTLSETPLRVEFVRMVDTTAPTRASSQVASMLPEPERSLVAAYLEFADELAAMSASYKTRAQDVRQRFSTSQNEATSSSVASVEASALSPLHVSTRDEG